MAVYTVHVPSSPAGGPSPEAAIFLRDGFSWPAFAFGPFWLAWRRAFVPAAVWAALLGVIAGAGAALGLDRAAISILETTAGVILGFEGSRLVAWSLARRGYAEAAVQVAESLDEAEEVFYASLRQRASAGGPRPFAAGVPGAAPHVIGGLFEEPRH